MEEKREKHESYGLLGFSRQTTSGKGKNLFGSSIPHNNTISIRIKRAEKTRSLNRNWYLGHEELIEVEMSYTQFTEAITAMNMGDGVPVTIKHVNRKRMEEPPDDNLREKLSDEFQDKLNETFEDSTKSIAAAQKLLAQKKSLNKSEKELLLNLLYSINQNIESNLRFVADSFHKQAEKSVTEAKGEIEAFQAATINRLGLDELKNKIVNGDDILKIKE